MDHKSSIKIIVSGLAAVLCISFGIIFHDSGGGDTYVIVNSGSEIESETETEAQTTIANAFEAAEKTTAATAAATTAAAVKSPTEAEAEEILGININTEAAEELMKLSGIGEVIAERIVEYRNLYGDFRNVDELLYVDGIGESKLEKIRDSIYVENPTYDYVNDEISEEIEEVIEDETQAEIYTEAAEEPLTEAETVTEHQRTLEEAAPIDINTADAEELMLLPYVTEEIAEQIIELRESIGGYSHPYELLYIEELEQKQVAEIIEFVTVGE
ncbi:MAG: helix-hairpin-helix domain-containing protein [Ruminococcus sp.]|nr:helix-hairpin-helix domain-containing protein [Ruminococcus sp.]